MVLFNPRSNYFLLRYLKEREICLDHFSSWTEQDQIEFVEELLKCMQHHQHGTVNAFLKPMLQRDFISLLPKKVKSPFTLQLMPKRLFIFRGSGSGSCCREHSLVPGRQVPVLRRLRVQGVVQGHLRGNALEEADRAEGQHRQSVEGARGQERVSESFGF